MSMSLAVRRVSSSWPSWLSLAILLLASTACGDDKTPPTQPSPTPPTPTPPTTVTVTLGRVTQTPTGVGLVLATPFAFTAEGFSVSDGSALTYTWDFGDGSRQTGGPSVSHTYGGQGVFPVTLTVTTAVGVSASATPSTVTVVAVTGRFGLQDASGAILLRNSSLNQNGMAIGGDDTSLNCRFAISGTVVAPSGITLTWTRARNDCAGTTLPVTFSFTGVVNETAGGFLGTLDTGVPARLVACSRPGCD
jgi:PKD repeat protein